MAFRSDSVMRAKQRSVKSLQTKPPAHRRRRSAGISLQYRTDTGGGLYDALRHALRRSDANAAITSTQQTNSSSVSGRKLVKGWRSWSFATDLWSERSTVVDTPCMDLTPQTETSSTASLAGQKKSVAGQL
jgi:hypothetical protein